ncbi:MAG TPA: PA domain-containing protein, partial [Polyangia bacterium]|nr:PA domain-containing protein [Polyangia bacterium]
MRRPAFSAAGAAMLALAALWPARAQATATLTIENLDDPGEGFNDPTPVAPVGGNPGTTVGAQRLNTFKQAASLWGTMIDSNVPIVIAAQFSPLTCSATSITLGQARTSSVEIDQPGSPPNVLVPEALADRLAGVDLHPGMEDIDAQFNGALADCSGGTEDWYYGFDGKPPGNDLDLLSVLLHELGHGLGFVSDVDFTSGALLGGYADVFTAHLYDDQAGMLWTDMTDDQRAASAQNARHLVWQGDNVAKMAPMVLAKGAPRLTPSPGLAGLSGALSESIMGPLLSAGRVQGPVVVGTPADGCSSTPPSYAGEIALFQGGCDAAAVGYLAGSTGALAVLISDPAGEAPPSSVEAPPTEQAMYPVTIPIIGVTPADAALLAAGAESVVLDADGTRLVGADAQGRMYMYACDPLVEGSTVSHWDPLARPNLMEEPNSSFIISHDIRMEAALMRDIGWMPFCGNGQLDPGETCDDGALNSDTTPGACRTDCTRSHCGDGVLDAGEACDDGAQNSDTAPGACRTTCVKAGCGDGVVDPGEACDDGARNGAGAACTAQCQIPGPQTGAG